MIFDVKKYREAKILVEELSSINSVIQASSKAFIKYKKYKEVQEILAQLRDSRFIINLHLKQQKTVLKSKGKISSEKPRQS